MTPRTLQRFAALVILAATLFLIAAAPAQARQLEPMPSGWQWLQDLWTKSASSFWNWLELTASDRPAQGNSRKAGHGTDPNGSTLPGPGTSSSTCSDCGDAGHGTDPNG